MGFVVKNTTKCGLIDLLCPHTCRGCGRLGSVLCECCKNDMLQDFRPFCPLCKNPFTKPAENVKNNRGISQDDPKSQQCSHCDLPLDGLWCFGWREGALEKLVEEYKYQSVRAMGDTLVTLYDAILPRKLTDVTIIPLPTIGRHIRERGFDHTLTLAKKLARLRGYQCKPILSRTNDTVQVGSKISERKTQASKAYCLAGDIDPKQKYLLLDDVWTTGSTMLAAAKILKDAGATKIYGAVLAVSKHA